MHDKNSRFVIVRSRQLEVYGTGDVPGISARIIHDADFGVEIERGLWGHASDLKLTTHAAANGKGTLHISGRRSSAQRGELEIDIGPATLGGRFAIVDELVSSHPRQILVSTLPGKRCRFDNVLIRLAGEAHSPISIAVQGTSPDDWAFSFGDKSVDPIEAEPSHKHLVTWQNTSNGIEIVVGQLPEPARRQSSTRH